MHHSFLPLLQSMSSQAAEQHGAEESSSSKGRKVGLPAVTKKIKNSSGAYVDQTTTLLPSTPGQDNPMLTDYLTMESAV